jgi:hypothetical protein
MANEIEREVHVKCDHCGGVAYSGVEWKGMLCNVDDGPNGTCFSCHGELCEACSQQGQPGVPWETATGEYRDWPPL